MFDFIRKDLLWRALDQRLDISLSSNQDFHLKTVQDLAVFSYLHSCDGKRIAEVGGGNSRLLRSLAKNNYCVNIEKFDGSHGGPSGSIEIAGVQNVLAYLGDFSPNLPNGSFDILFSISVIEHVPTQKLANFFDDGMRILRPGGLWVHAIDMYVEDEPSDYHIRLFETYRSWMMDPRLSPLGNVIAGPPRFTCDMATNPDNVMYHWGRISPDLIPIRKRAQSVSLLMIANRN